MTTPESRGLSQVTLVDLLDRLLDRGLIIDADIIISLAGVPLIGVKLRAAVAGMETMTRYGVMTELDQSIRTREQLQRPVRGLVLRNLQPPPSAAVPVSEGREA